MPKGGGRGRILIYFSSFLNNGTVRRVMPSVEVVLQLDKLKHLESCRSVYRKVSYEGSSSLNTATMRH